MASSEKPTAYKRKITSVLRAILQYSPIISEGVYTAGNERPVAWCHFLTWVPPQIVLHLEHEHEYQSFTECKTKARRTGGTKIIWPWGQKRDWKEKDERSTHRYVHFPDVEWPSKLAGNGRRLQKTINAQCKTVVHKKTYGQIGKKNFT